MKGWIESGTSERNTMLEIYISKLKVSSFIVSPAHLNVLRVSVSFIPLVMIWQRTRFQVKLIQRGKGLALFHLIVIGKVERRRCFAADGNELNLLMANCIDVLCGCLFTDKSM